MKSYVFRVVLEKDKWPNEPDSEAVWHAYIPALRSKGGASWGYAQKEALESMRNAVDMVLESMIERGESVPAEPTSEVRISAEPLIGVTV